MNRCCPIACDLTVFSPDERAAHDQDTKRVAATAAAITETATGFELRFTSVEEGLLDRWAAAERRCCPFLAIDVSPLRLGITAPAEARPILRALFGAAAPAPGA